MIPRLRGAEMWGGPYAGLHYSVRRPDPRWDVGGGWRTSKLMAEVEAKAFKAPCTPRTPPLCEPSVPHITTTALGPLCTQLRLVHAALSQDRLIWM